MLVQAFRPEPPIERFDKRVVGRLSGPLEVEDDIVGIGPEIEVARYELGSLVHTDRLGVSDHSADSFQCVDDVLGPVAEPRVHDRGVTGKGVDDRQYAYLVPAG